MYAFYTKLTQFNTTTIPFVVNLSIITWFNIALHSLEYYIVLLFIVNIISCLTQFNK